jgi:hypothetical protein
MGELRDGWLTRLDVRTRAAEAEADRLRQLGEQLALALEPFARRHADGCTCRICLAVADWRRETTPREGGPSSWLE